MREKIISTITLTSIFTLFLYYKINSNDNNIAVSQIDVKSDLIDYNIDKDSNIKLVVYNLLGQEIKILEDNYKQQGSYTTFWNGLNNNGDIMPSGLYFIKISNFQFQDIKRVTLLK